MAEFEDLLDQNIFKNCKNLESLHIEGGKSKVNIKASIIDFKGLKGLASLKRLRIGDFIIQGINDKVFLN